MTILKPPILPAAMRQLSLSAQVETKNCLKKIGLKSFSLRRQDMTLVGLKIYPFNSEDKEVCFVSLPDLVLSSFGVIKNIYISTQC